MISGMLAIGNGEKCPFCKTIMTKDIKIFDHMINKHKEKLLENLFYKEEDYATTKSNKQTKIRYDNKRPVKVNR